MSEEGAGVAGDFKAGEPLKNSDMTPKNSKRATLKEKVRAIYEKHHPTSEPIEFVTDVIVACVFDINIGGFGGGLGFLFCVGFVLLLKFLPIATFVIGVMYRDQEKYCPAEPIPFLLIIDGSIYLARKFFGRFTKSENAAKGEGGAEIDSANSNGPQQATSKPGPCAIVAGLINRILYFASFASFFTSCFLVYRLYSDVSYEESSPTEEYCHPVLYRFAFWLMTLPFICWGLMLVVGLWAWLWVAGSVGVAED